MNALNYIRSHISPQTRESLYVLATLGVAGVGVTAQENHSLEQAVTSVVLTAVALLLAVLNSTPRMAAVYAFLGAVGGVAQILAVQHEGTAWAGYLGLGAVILAKVVAALRSPTALPVTVAAVIDSAAAQLGDQLSPDNRKVVDALAAQARQYVGEHRAQG